jgi:serine/threonine protein kinase
LGEGAFGGVYKVTELDSEGVILTPPKIFAMKVVERRKLRMHSREANTESMQLINECKCLHKLHHPNIVQLKEVIDDGKNTNLYLIM